MSHRSDRDSFDIDEQLSALLDDVLPPEEARALRARIDRDESLKTRMDDLARANAAVRDAYAGVADEPLPAGVLELLTPARRTHSNVVGLARGEKKRAYWVPLAAAASIALAVGVSLGVLIAPRAPTPDPLALVAGDSAAGTALDAVLRSVPSGSPQPLSPTVSATARLTFRTTTGSYCRHVDLTGDRGTTQTLACLADGRWRIEVATFASAAEPGETGLYRPASGPSAPIDDAIDVLIDGAPLEAEAERAVIRRGWADDAAAPEEAQR